MSKDKPKMPKPAPVEPPPPPPPPIPVADPDSEELKKRRAQRTLPAGVSGTILSQGSQKLGG